MKSKSFTLIELIFILTTIVVVVAVSTLDFKSYGETLSHKELFNQSRYKEFKRGIKRFFEDMGRLPQNIFELLVDPTPELSQEEEGKKEDDRILIEELTIISSPELATNSKRSTTEWRGPYLSYLPSKEFNSPTRSISNYYYLDGYKNFFWNDKKDEEDKAIYRDKSSSIFYRNPSSKPDEEELSLSRQNLGWLYLMNNYGEAFQYGKTSSGNNQFVPSNITIQSLQEVRFKNDGSSQDKNFKEEDKLELESSDFYIKCAPWEFTLIIANESFEEQSLDKVRVGIFYRGISNEKSGIIDALSVSDPLEPVSWLYDKELDDDDAKLLDVYRMNHLANFPLLDLGASDDKRIVKINHGNYKKFVIRIGTRYLPKYIPKSNISIILYNDVGIEEEGDGKYSSKNGNQILKSDDKKDEDVKDELLQRIVQKVPPVIVKLNSVGDLPKKVLMKIPPPIMSPRPDLDLKNFLGEELPVAFRKDVEENIKAVEKQKEKNIKAVEKQEEKNFKIYSNDELTKEIGVSGDNSLITKSGLTDEIFSLWIVKKQDDNPLYSLKKKPEKFPRLSSPIANTLKKGETVNFTFDRNINTRWRWDDTKKNYILDDSSSTQLKIYVWAYNKKDPFKESEFMPDMDYPSETKTAVPSDDDDSLSDVDSLEVYISLGTGTNKTYYFMKRYYCVD